jgi:hypothetical protein
VFSIVTHLDHYEDGPFPMVHATDVRFHRESAGALLRRIAGLGCDAGALVVPHFPEEVRLALLLRELTGMPLATWVMDDSVLETHRISRAEMDRLFAESAVRFVISPEMASDYAREFGKSFEVLPPTVSRREMRSFASAPESSEQATGIMLLGSMWNEDWIPALRSLLLASGLTADWYGSHPPDYGGALRDSIRPHGFVSEDELVAAVAGCAFAIVPTGSGLEDDRLKGLTRWSLPSRLVYLVAACRLPVLVIGSECSCAASFVRSLGVGLVCNYEAGAFASAVESMRDRVQNLEFRKRCVEVAPDFVSDGLDRWIWDSMELGRAVDVRFSKVFCKALDPVLT